MFSLAYWNTHMCFTWCQLSKILWNDVQSILFTKLTHNKTGQNRHYSDEDALTVYSIVTQSMDDTDLSSRCCNAICLVCARKSWTIQTISCVTVTLQSLVGITLSFQAIRSMRIAWCLTEAGSSRSSTLISYPSQLATAVNIQNRLTKVTSEDPRMFPVRKAWLKQRRKVRISLGWLFQKLLSQDSICYNDSELLNSAVL